jgi:hypothetical protein
MLNDAKTQRRWPSPDILSRAKFVDNARPISSLILPTLWSVVAQWTVALSTTSSENGSATLSRGHRAALSLT